MNILTEPYNQYREKQPKSGRHILCYQTEKQLVVYQAYNKSIAEFAITNQFLGGPSFSYDRMSWIKPNFLWMMYRCGWAEKENQERILALWIEKADFENILEQAVSSSFNEKNYDNHEQWKYELNSKDVRLQWDPDHDPYGNKIERRAIQLGLKGKILESFGKYQVKKIEDITDFVRQQKLAVNSKQLNNLLVPVETIFQPTNEKLSKKIGLDKMA